MLIGLIGKPSCGKSTFFKAATLAEVEIASYPFTTIKPNHGIGYVKVECVEKEFNTKCMPNHGFCIKGQRFVPIDLIDVAGLVPGASEGKGLGNQFLDDLRQADAFIHIVDLSGETDAEGKLLEGKNYDICNDVRFLEIELDKWYFAILSKVWKTFSKQLDTGKDVNYAKAIAKQFSGLGVKEEHAKTVFRNLGINESLSKWSENQIFRFASLLRKESKPMIIAANKIDTEKGEENLKKLKKEFPDLIIVPCSADFELALREAAKHELISYIPGEKEFEVLKELSDKQKQALDKIKTKVLNVYEKT